MNSANMATLNSSSPKRIHSKDLVNKSASYTSNFATQRNAPNEKIFKSIEEKGKKVAKKRTNPCLQELRIAGLAQTQSIQEHETSNNISHSMSFEQHKSPVISFATFVEKSHRTRNDGNKDGMLGTATSVNLNENWGLLKNSILLNRSFQYTGHSELAVQNPASGLPLPQTIAPNSHRSINPTGTSQPFFI